MAAELAKLRATFQEYDLDSDGSITPDEMNRYLNTVMQQFTSSGPGGVGGAEVQRRAKQAADKMFAQADADHNGRVTFDEFCTWHRTYVAPPSGAAGGAATAPATAPAAPPVAAATAAAVGARAPSAAAAAGAGAWSIEVAGATYCHVKTDASGASDVVALSTLDKVAAASYKHTFVCYLLKMRLGADEWTAMRRFSSLEAFVSDLKKRGLVRRRAGQASFPAKTRLGQANVPQRVEKLGEYFSELTRAYASLGAEPFVQAFMSDCDVGEGRGAAAAAAAAGGASAHHARSASQAQAALAAETREGTFLAAAALVATAQARKGKLLRLRVVAPRALLDSGGAESAARVVGEELARRLAQAGGAQVLSAQVLQSQHPDAALLLAELLEVLQSPAHSGGLGGAGAPVVPVLPALLELLPAVRALDSWGTGAVSTFELGGLVARRIQLPPALAQQLEGLVAQAKLGSGAAGAPGGEVDYHRFLQLLGAAAAQQPMQVLAAAAPVPDIFADGAEGAQPGAAPGAADVVVEVVAQLAAGTLDAGASARWDSAKQPPPAKAAGAGAAMAKTAAAAAAAAPEVPAISDMAWETFRSQIASGVNLTKHEQKSKAGGAVVPAERTMSASASLKRLTWRKKGVKGAVGQLGTFDLSAVGVVATAEAAEWASIGGHFPFMRSFAWDEGKRDCYFVLIHAADPSALPNGQEEHLALEAPSKAERDRLVGGFRRMAAQRGAAFGDGDELDAVFRVFDVNGDGSISPFELGQALSDMGHPMHSEAELRQIIAQVKLDRAIDPSTDPEPDAMSLDDFKYMMRDRDERQELMDAFRKFDLDGDGFVSAFELGQALGQMGEGNISEEDAMRMIAQVDSNGDGLLSYEEFVEMMV